MAAPFTKSVSLLPLFLLITIFVLLKGVEPISIIPKVTVFIINDMLAPPAEAVLTLHCKSKYDDLGFHTLKFGEDYEFTFRPNVVKIAGVTLFFCSFTWPGETPLHYFDIYDQARDDCQSCYWKISKEGACKYNPNLGTFEKCYPWNPPQSHTQLGVSAWNKNTTSHL